MTPLSGSTPDTYVFRLPCAVCDGAGWIYDLVVINGQEPAGGACPGCDGGWVRVRLTGAMVEAAFAYDGPAQVSGPLIAALGEPTTEADDA